MNSEVPYVTFTRTPADDKATYIGPFYGKTAVEKALRVLRRIFPYYDKPYTGKKTLNTDLGLTPGIEIGKCEPKDYKRNLKKLMRYLEGDRDKLLKELEKTMQEAAKNEEYELAAEAKYQIEGIKELRKKIVFSDKEFMDISNDQALKQLQQLLGLENPPRRIEGYDISHQSGADTVASMVVFINGASARDKYRKFKIRTSKSDDLKSMAEVITRRMKHAEWEMPDLIVIDGGANQVKAVAELTNGIPVVGRNKSGDHTRNASAKLVYLENGDIVEKPLSTESHIAKLIARIDEEAHRFAITYHSLLKRKNLFK